LRRYAIAASAAVSLALVAAPARAGWFDDSVTEPFLVPADITDASLSPDGRHVAAILVDKEQRAGLGIFDVDAVSWQVAVKADVTWTDGRHGYWRVPYRVNWLDDELLALDFNDDTAAQYHVDGRYSASIGARYIGLIRPDGSSTRQLAAIGDRTTNRLVSSPLGIGPEQPVKLAIGGDAILDWLTDDTGLIRAARAMHTDDGKDVTRIATLYRRSEASPWAVIDERSITDDEFRPVLVDAEGDRLVVQARNGGDRYAMWEFDLSRKAIGELAAGHPTEDVVAFDADSDTHELTRVTTDGLKPQTVWLDRRMASLQRLLDEVYSDHVNVLQAGKAGQVLVFSYSDVDPGRYSLLDTQAKSLREIAAVRPGIDPKRMQPMQALHYPSFDGLSIPAYLTLPGKPQKPSPLIVLIHGGPQARDRWGWQQDVQVFAAHGYAVFQPQFRGSAGFGKKFEEAGYGQWGQAMQDDITAGVRWLVDRKIADPQRICIIGSSYGGYVALWGLEKTPDLYKCGASDAGVSDLETLLREESDLSKSAVKRELTHRRIGDPALMTVAFDSVSPLKHADRIKAPLLVAHGKFDERVPVSHGRRMVDVMKALDKDVQWLEFEHEKHSLWLVEDQRQWYDAVFALLKRTIGKGEPPRLAESK
jgi:dipeptidyl aminopeptidase/acylaminoacyl peptidase